MSRRKQTNPKPLLMKVAPPGGPAQGGEEMVTLADEKRNDSKKMPRSYNMGDDHEDADGDFRPLVIDTPTTAKSSSATTRMEQDKQMLLRQLSRDMAMYRENNPSDTELEGFIPPRPTDSLHVTPGGSVFPGLAHNGTSDSSAPSSRVHSPALSTASNSGGSTVGKTGKASQPQKARRKTDKILPSDSGKYVCPICQTAVASNTELTKHIRSHNSGGPVTANTCTICGKVLSSQSSLDRHMLVHSGERPFKCKYCSMSFTTNGNMHRHSRIHQKEGRTEKEMVAATPSSSSSMTSSVSASAALSTNSSQPRYMAGSHSANNGREYSQVGFPNPLLEAASRLRQMDLMNSAAAASSSSSSPMVGTKRKLSFDPSDDMYLSPSFVSGSLNAGSNKRRSLAGLAGSSAPSGVKREFTIVSPDGRPVNAVTPSPPSSTSNSRQHQQASPTAAIGERNNHRDSKVLPPSSTSTSTMPTESKSGDADQQEFQCPECSMSFLCRYGLESHLQTHPNFSFSCQLCPRTFRSRQDLVLHKFQEHKCSVLYNPVDKSSTTASGASPSDAEDVAVGFHELDFIDFTCDKFPLVAQAWCDENVHHPSSAFHDFTCRLCKKAFPCKAALRIHANTHAPDDMTSCTKCDIHLPDHKAHTTHMLSHIAPKVVSRVSKTDGKSDSPQEVVSKEDFLTCFGLTVNKGEKTDGEGKSSAKKPPAEHPRKHDMGINEHYYPLLQRMALMQAERRREAAQAGLLPFQQSPLRAPQGPPAPTAPSRGYRDNNNPDNGGGDLADIQQILSRFGSGGGLVNIKQSFAAAIHGSPKKDSENKRAYNPMAMVPGQQRLSMEKDADSGMRLPVMVTNGFVPIPNEPYASDDAPAMSNETFQCKYCPEVFNNFKSYKSHTRAHLGLAPYKCNMCPYTSADKSTLIRHLRTHNGERPFQCRICEFAFTTKANCERHVRKKHMRFSKKDIDDAIGYNHYSTDIDQGVDSSSAFASPVTVCKFCGEDFRFFQALKHHLRSNSACTRKPFVCRICEAGCSTRTNAARHVQKHHPHVEQHRLEEQIYVNELLAAEVAEDIKVYESIEAMDGRENGSNGAARHPLYGHTVNPIVISPIPQHGGRSVSPAPAPARPAPTFITSPPIMSIEPELLNAAAAAQQSMDYDQPLDFSMKSSMSGPNAAKRHQTGGLSLINMENSSSHHMSGGHAIELSSSATACSSDEPMDLTVSKPSTSSSASSSSTSTIAGSSAYRSASSSLSAPYHQQDMQRSSTPNGSKPHPAMTLNDLPPDVAARALPQLLASKATPDYGMLRYKKEYQKYYNPTVGRLQCPYCKMLFKHGLKLQVHIRSHTNERPFSCAYCSASFTIKTNLERHLKTRHPHEPHFIPDVPAMVAPLGGSGGSNSRSCSPVREVIEIPQPSTVVAAEAARNNSAGFVRSPKSNQTGSDDSNSDLSSVNKILDATNANHFRNFFTATANSDESISESPVPASPFARYREKMNVSGGDENSNHSTKSAAIPAAQDTAEDDIDDDIVSEEGDIPEIIIPNAANLSPEEIIKQTTENLPIIKIRNPKALEKSTDDGSPAKKKRNSYADSPHKLMCPYCPRAFPWISSLNRHILTHTGQKPYKCPQCPVMFSTKSNRERHLVRKHGLNVLDPATRQMMDRPFKCHLCIFSSFSTGANLHKHYTEKHADEPMPEHLICEGDANNNTDTYSAECQENNQVAEASKAKRLEFESLDDEDSKDGIQDGLGSKLMDHVQSSMLSGSPSSTPTRALSPAPPGDESAAAAHTNPERDNYNVDKITECWKCDTEFTSRKGLLRHLKEHNIDLAYKCYLCDASFESRRDSLEHMADKHASDWVVLGDKNQVGDIADFADCMNRIVEQNFIGNPDAKLTEAEMARCKVQLHADDMKPESDYTQRKVYCSLCPKRFWSLQDLRRHMRSHTGERPFECDLCQKRFTLKHSMMRHRRKHMDSGAASLSASDDEGHGPLNRPDSPDADEQATSRSSTYVENKKSDEGGVAGTKGGLAGKLGSDLLHNLLGVEDSAIDEMLNSADAAARVLGVDNQ